MFTFNNNNIIMNIFSKHLQNDKNESKLENDEMAKTLSCDIKKSVESILRC